jgi:hypothetical protein
VSEMCVCARAYVRACVCGKEGGRGRLDGRMCAVNFEASSDVHILNTFITDRLLTFHTFRKVLIMMASKFLTVCHLVSVV